ncbi:MAG: hypothetical protein HC896_16775 [Bacteroidales bacterium]|nr:hypothetical protein [Bacteroidales bacterium]
MYKVGIVSNFGDKKYFEEHIKMFHAIKAAIMFNIPPNGSAFRIQEEDYELFLLDSDVVVFDCNRINVFRLIEKAVKRLKHILLINPWNLDARQAKKMVKLAQEVKTTIVAVDKDPDLVLLHNLLPIISDARFAEYELYREQHAGFNMVGIRQDILKTLNILFSLKTNAAIKVNTFTHSTGPFYPGLVKANLRFDDDAWSALNINYFGEKNKQQAKCVPNGRLC